jgi:hypothetical protein
MDVPVDVKHEEYLLMLMMLIEDDETYRQEHDDKVQDQIGMEYVQDERNKNEDPKNIECLHIMLIDRFHLNKLEEFLDNELPMKIN